jgi:hypothetical protein
MNFHRKQHLSPRIALLCAACVSLLAGVLIYALFRNANLLVFALTGKIPLWEQLYRRGASGGLFFNILVYNAPDGLWLLSGILYIRALWLEQKTKARVYIFSLCFLALLFELLQCFGVMPGTFDVLDLIVMVLTAFGESVCYKHFMQRRFSYAQ